MRQKLTKELLTELYVKQGLNFKEIGDIAGGWDNSWVRRKVIQYGIPLRNKGIELSKFDLVKMYGIEMRSQKEIAKLIGRSQYYVRSKMIQFSIESRDSGEAQAMKRGIQFNEAFFDTWNKEMAYVLGFIYADGNITDYRLTIQVSKKDRQILETICRLLDFPLNKIFTQHHKEFDKYSVGISPSRKRVALRLRELGVIPNKSKTMEFPYIPYEYLSDFIRGYFDGDGSVSLSSCQCNVQFSCGSKSFALELREYLSIILDHDVRYSLDKRTSETNPNYSVKFHSSRLAKKLYDYMYYEGCPCLERKRRVFEEYAQ